MQGLEEISELPEDSAMGVPASENYRTTYWRRPNPKSAIGEDRFYPLHPNLPRYPGPSGSYVIPYLKGKCESWMPAFQVADVDWLTAVTKTLDPTSKVRGRSGLTSGPVRSERLDYLDLDLGQELQVPFKTKVESLPKGMTFGGHSLPNPSLLFELVEFSASVEIDVIVVDVKCHTKYWWDHLEINLKAMRTLTRTKAVVVIDRELDQAYATESHPVFAKGLLAGVIVTRDLDAQPLKDANVVVYSNFPEAETLYKDKLRRCRGAWMLADKGKGEYVLRKLYETGSFVYVNLLKPERNLESPGGGDRTRVVVFYVGKESFALPYGIGKATEIVADALDDLLDGECTYGEVLEVMKMIGGYRPEVFGIYPEEEDVVPGRPDLTIADALSRMVSDFLGQSKPAPKASSKPSKPRPSLPKKAPSTQAPQARPKGVGRVFKRA